ncbi:hypothetical protein FGADI_9027 [Fusarium gaditjirri]|uniref:Uncharacterized protein n=1 Tax=Fusarium gaditjirri TaxID=282569 RepID=A0A8H4T0T8_9HYPO|nr:hypothetical protein FGADI_9027 [Fusarium gaditjirri]
MFFTCLGEPSYLQPGFSYWPVFYSPPPWIQIVLPIFWDIARDNFPDEEIAHCLCEALFELQSFDFKTESSNGWSVNQKICAVTVATAVIDEILTSYHLVDAFHDANDTVENWIKNADLLKPGMILPPYMSFIINPQFRHQALGRYDLCLVFGVPSYPDWESEELALESELEEEKTGSKNGTIGGLVEELEDSLRRIKLGRRSKD